MAVPGRPRPSSSGRPVAAARSPLTITFRPKAIVKGRCVQYVSVKPVPAAGGTHGLPEPARPATGIADGSPRTSGCRRCRRTAAAGRQPARAIETGRPPVVRYRVTAGWLVRATEVTTWRDGGRGSGQARRR